MGGTISDEVCIVCETSDLEILSEGVYRCNQCGYEGGSRRPQWLKEKRRLAVDTITGEARRERVLTNLTEARRLVESALGTIEEGCRLQTSQT